MDRLLKYDSSYALITDFFQISGIFFHIRNLILDVIFASPYAMCVGDRTGYLLRGNSAAAVRSMKGERKEGRGDEEREKGKPYTLGCYS